MKEAFKDVNVSEMYEIVMSLTTFGDVKCSNLIDVVFSICTRPAFQ